MRTCACNGVLTRRADYAGHNPHANIAAFLTPNARVSVEATFLDATYGPRWSGLTFGAEWADARVFGAVFVFRRRKVGCALRRWERNSDPQRHTSGKAARMHQLRSKENTETFLMV
jgi:hypothetical protein